MLPVSNSSLGKWRQYSDNRNTLSGTVKFSVTANYGPFALASITSENPLPVELLSFQKQLQKAKRCIALGAATEEINKWLFYNWKKGMVFILNLSKYRWSREQHANTGIRCDGWWANSMALSYYRIKQTDFWRAFSLSNIVSIRFRSTHPRLFMCFWCSERACAGTDSVSGKRKCQCMILRDPLGRIVQNLPLITKIRIMQCQFIFQLYLMAYIQSRLYSGWEIDGEICLLINF